MAALLGLTHADVEAAIDDAHVGRLDGSLPGSSMALAGMTLSAWRSGCLHRGYEPSRTEWEALAVQRGLVLGGVTKRTRLVVAADPDSASGKAAKARSYGIPIINEAAFAKLLANS